MSVTKEAELTTAVLLYAVRCLAEGDQHALRAMNFGAKEVEALHALDLTDLYRVQRLQAHCLQVQLDRDVYWPLMAYLRRERASATLQRTLIQADAPFEMMQRLFGLSSRDYTRLRRLFGVPPAVGRPPEPDQDLSHKSLGRNAGTSPGADARRALRRGLFGDRREKRRIPARRVAAHPALDPGGGVVRRRRPPNCGNPLTAVFDGARIAKRGS